jgi:O-antigen/teichoic acid export membrane protein
MFAFATQLTTAGFTAALTLFLTRELGPAGFGTLSLALGITGIMQRVSGAGPAQATARFVAERHGDLAGITGVLGMALRLRFVTATAITVALFALAGPISDAYGAPEMTWPLRGVAIAYFGQSIFLLAQTVFTSLRRVSSSFILVLSESAMEFTATIALVLLGGGVTGAAFGRAVGYVFGGLLGVILLGMLLGRSPVFKTGASPVPRREFMGYAGGMLVVGGTSAVFNQLDVLLIGAFLSTTAVGIYSAPLRLIALAGYPGLALAQGVAPRMARHPDDPPSVAALLRGTRYMLVLQAGIVAFVTVWATPIVELTLGSQYSESAAVLRALAPLVFLTGLGPMLSAPLNFAGEGTRRIPFVIAAAVVGAALMVALIPDMGILGAAVGTDVGYAVNVGGHLWLCHRFLGLPVAPLAGTLARALVAGAAMAGVLALVGTGSISAFGWIAGLAGGSVAFAGALLLTRELSLEELRSLPSQR